MAQQVLMRRQSFDQYRRYFNLGDMQKPSEQEFFKNEVVDVKSLATLTAAILLAHAGVSDPDPYAAIGRRVSYDDFNDGTRTLSGLMPTLGYGAEDFQYFMSRAFAVAYSLGREVPVYVIVPVIGKVVEDQFPEELEVDYSTLSSRKMTKVDASSESDLGLPMETQLFKYTMEGSFPQSVTLVFADTSTFSGPALVDPDGIDDREIPKSGDISDHQIDISVMSFYMTPTNGYVLIAPPSNDIQFQTKGRKLNNGTGAWGYLEKYNFQFWRFWMQTGLNAIDNPLQYNQIRFTAHLVNPALFYLMPFIEDVVFRKLTGKWGKDSLYPTKYPYEKLRGMIENYENSAYSRGTNIAIVVDAAANAVKKYYDDPDGDIWSSSEDIPVTCFGPASHQIQF